MQVRPRMAEPRVQGCYDSQNTLSFLAVADPRHRCDRAAPLSRWLAAGVGSRVAVSRRVVSRVGQARLARQTCSAVAQPGRVYGCAVVATKKTGGRNVSRLALWRADVTQNPGLYSKAGASGRLPHAA